MVKPRSGAFPHTGAEALARVAASYGFDATVGTHTRGRVALSAESPGNLRHAELIGTQCTQPDAMIALRPKFLTLNLPASVIER